MGPGLLWFVATQLEIVEMSVEQRLKELNIELPKVGSGVSEARGLVRVRMHIKREIAMDQIHFARSHIVVDHLL